MQTRTSTIVKELADAANAVHDAAKAMKNSKDTSRKISKVALKIATGVENAAAAAHRRGKESNVAISVESALCAARDIFAQCASFMRNAAGKGAFTRYFEKGLTADTVGGYLASVEGLYELLKIHDNECGIMLEPFSGLGIDETCGKDVLNANIQTMDAAYDGLKSTINVMINITDGLPWPLKAAPQTFLYILQLFESCQSVRPKITSLLFAVQTLWKAVEKISPEAIADNLDLRHHLSAFYETLQRIAIRLHIVLRVGQVKRAMAIHTVNACLVLEEQRIVEAGRAIMTVFSVETLNELRRLRSEVARLRPSTLAETYDIDLSISTSLPPKPIVFHGRDVFVSNAVGLLTASSSTRLAVLGPGGMGKTTIALAILYNSQIVQQFRDRRFFLPCEALVDANSLLISLAKLLKIPVSADLLAAIMTRLTDMPRTLLILDNLETVWLANGAPAAAVEDLLGRLAQIPSLSVIITCRGIILPQLVEWSNPDTAALEPFSLEAALETFQDRAGFRLTGVDEDIAKELLTAVDHMPLAVTLLGQLARRGTPVLELLDRWNREHSALLRTHNVGRINNAEVSVKISIALVSSADDSGESLELLSVCCLLPDGLRPEVFNKMRVHFKHIDRARDTLMAYALATRTADGALKTFSPVRHVVLENHPAQANHRDALHAIYFDIANSLPDRMNDTFQELTAATAPEMGNLSSLLLTLVSQPSQRIVDSVVRLTHSALFHQPTVTVASALLPHLDSHFQWTASCMRATSRGFNALGEYVAAFETANDAAKLYVRLGDPSSAAQCKCIAGEAYRVLGEYSHAEMLFEEARGVFEELRDEHEEARSRFGLDLVAGNPPSAIEHLTAARLTMESEGDLFYAARCTQALGDVYFRQGELAAAVAEFEAAHAVFIGLGIETQIPQTALLLGNALCKQGNFTSEEQYFMDAYVLHRKSGDRFGLAGCAQAFRFPRLVQQRREEALVQFNLASHLYQTLHMHQAGQRCRKWIKMVESTDGATE